MSKKRQLTSDASRELFEDWIGNPPYERDTSRWPNDETKHSWPGQYQDIDVQLAWEAWCESATIERENAEKKHHQTPMHLRVTSER